MKTLQTVQCGSVRIWSILFLVSIFSPLAVSAGGPSVEVFQPIQFTDASAGEPTSWFWDFDYDGMVPEVGSEIQNPIFTFTEVRTYQVYLEVCNFADCHFTVKDVEVTVQNSIFNDGFESGDFSSWMVVANP